MTDQDQNDNKPGARVAIGKRLRFDVFKRDGFKCAYCGAHPPSVMLECDHIHPVALGGSNDIDNLITACFNCNRGKADKSLSDVPQSMSERASEVLEREAQVVGYESVMRERRMRLDADAQEVLEFFCEYHNRTGIPKDHFTSIKRFCDKLGLDTVLWATERACGQHKWNYRKCFAYFCGICWNRIRDMEAGNGSN